MQEGNSGLIMFKRGLKNEILKGKDGVLQVVSFCVLVFSCLLLKKLLELSELL